MHSGGKKARRVLALDLAGTTGWAYSDGSGEHRAGIWTLTRGELGGRRSPVPMLRLWKRLERFATTVKVTKVSERAKTVKVTKVSERATTQKATSIERAATRKATCKIERTSESPRGNADRGVDKIVFEETFARGDARYRLDSLQHAVVLWCCLNGVRFQRVSPSAWKRGMLGSAKLTREQYWQSAIDFFPYLSVHSHDIAAALWLLEYEGAFEKEFESCSN